MTMRNFLDWHTGSWRSPFDELARLKAQMDRLYGGAEPAPAGSGVFPLVNVTEDADAYRIRAEIPGISAGDLDISVTGRTVTLSGERKIAPVEGASYHRRERRAGVFSRSLTMPAPVASEKVEALLENGVLTVALPKAEEAKPRQVSVKTV